MNFNNFLSSFGKLKSSPERNQSAVELYGASAPFESISNSLNVFDYTEEDYNPLPESVPDVSKTWSVVGRMEYITNRKVSSWEDVLEDLDVILDEYRGSVLYREVFIIFYYLMGTHLRPVQSPGGGLKKFRIEMEARVNLVHGFKLDNEKEKQINWVHDSMKNIRKCRITYMCSLKDTNRKGMPFKTMYLYPSLEGTPTPDLKTILAPHKIYYEDIGDNYRFYK
ncbi:matrix protein [Shayang Fly Virus 2]|uniref:Matrix protein n=1 Tax=Shayang Fly Virus 2 TaxID=1608066 RepID=A0A0B5KEV8_9RHAB|nr:matrix protein [Shayang Fly Virus 2]AJG39124.1 matrix protein [Shayang Fly Virus 2]